MQGLDRSQTGADEQFELPVNARSVGRAGIRCVRAGQDRHAGGVERADVGQDARHPLRIRFPAEVLTQTAALLGSQEGSDQRIPGQLQAARHPGDRLEHRECRDDEDPRLAGRFDEIRAARAIEVHVDQGVGTRGDGLPGLFRRADVEDGEQIVTVRGGRDPRQRRGCERGKRAPGGSGFVDHLDEVGSRGHAVGDEGLRLLRVVQGGQRDAELRAVPALDGNGAAGKDVGPVGNRSRCLLPSPLRRHGLRGEHVENRRDAEVQCLLERRPEVVRVAVDQSGQQGHAGAVDDLRVGAGGRWNVVA